MITERKNKHKPPSGDVTAIRGGAVTVAEAADAFLSSPRAASPNTRRAYADVIDRLVAELGPDRPLAAVPGDEIAAALHRRPQPLGSSPVIMRLIDRFSDSHAACGATGLLQRSVGNSMS